MSRLIDADALLKDMMEICPYNQFGRGAAKMCVNTAPTIDPVKHGQWIDRDTIDDDGNKDVECSECWHGDKQRPGISVPYCWFCGAKMDGAVVADQNTAKTAALDGQIGKEPCDCNAFRGGPDCGMDGDAHE